MFQPQEPFRLFPFGENPEQWEPIPRLRLVGGAWRGLGWGCQAQALWEGVLDGLVTSARPKEGSALLCSAQPCRLEWEVKVTA